MKACDACRDRLPLFLSGELNAEEAEETRSHLAVCSRCGREAEDIQRVDAFLRGAFDRQPVDTRALRARVLAAIPDEPAPRATGDWRGVTGAWLAFLRRPGPAWALGSLAFAIAAIAFLAWWRQTPAVYRQVAADHREDVVQKVKKSGWLRAEDAVREFTQAQFGDPSLAATLAPEGSRLSRVRLSRLGGDDYAHFVYAEADGREKVSVFVRWRRRPDETLPGRPAERTAEGWPLYAAARGETRLAGFDSPRMLVLVVGELPPEEAMRLARATAARLRERKTS